MIALDTDVLIEIFDKRSGKGDEALRKILECNNKISSHIETEGGNVRQF